MPDPSFHNLLQRLPAAIAAFTGEELRYDFANDSMRALLGQEDLEGRLASETLQMWPADLISFMQRVYSTGKSYVVKSCPLLAGTDDNGPTAAAYFDITLEPDPADDGSVQGLLLFAVDVTEQERTRQRSHELAVETRRLDARLRVLTETAPLISFTMNPEGEYEYVSPQWHTFTGQPTTCDITAVWPLLVHPDDRLRVLHQMDVARATGAAWSYECRLRRYDGQYRWMLSRAVPENHAFGKPAYWHGAMVEVHDQRELAEVLRKAEAELRFLADSIPELIWIASPTGLVNYYNQFISEYSGLTADELGPTGWINLLHPAEQAETARRWVFCVSSGEAFEGVVRMRRHDGAYRWHLIRARRLDDGQGLRWFGACTDVDDQNRLRQVLQTQYNELAQANRDLDTFVYTASHDLKQPVLNLRGLFDELRRAATFHDPEEAFMLQMLDEALLQLDTTLQELAATVRDQRGLSAPTEELDVPLVLEEVLLGLRTQVLESQATIDVDVDTGLQLHYGRANLRSVLHNLISNALKFAHPERLPHIRIQSAITEQGQPVLVVQDNGLGMVLPEQPAPVFQPFARQHAHIGGAGVGLYLVQRIVAGRGGRLEVASTVGEGTTFTIHWHDGVPAAVADE
ncbi:PAS domain-containing protein [Hymenobacter endophyticus]|uniref:histidine kinase n=1 Tax=Hymenobacter endophyticus TaxID=3076335 RepID=A0ABU3TJB3_9BACT|nr:PAS domain-containing protein [Hymenobacter endophyticus]MDU0371427.1 PAS domain-containing protein [Hymenobacter endophyticus]